MLRLRWAPVGVTTKKVKARSGKVGLHSVSRGSKSGGTVIYINPGAHPMSLETENRGCCRGLLQSEYKIQQEK